jgi:protocatechuate 3,4-dioxygenase beta subunit
MVAALALVGGLMASENPRATAHTVEGTVTSPGGAPIKEALVVVYPEMLARGEVPVTGSTDEEGRFRVTVGHGGEYFVSVDAQGFAPTSGIRARTGVRQPVKLENGRTLEGTVRDGVTGRPIRGARVAVRGSGLFLATDPRVGRREAVTDARGRYRLEQVPARADAIYATAKGYASSGAPVSRTATRADLMLQAGVWLSGTIRSARGPGVKGAVVTARDFESPAPEGGFGREETDAKGRFEIVGLASGLFHVTAYHPGFAPAFAPPVRVDGPVSIDLTLKDATTASGRLVDGDGNPAAGTIWMEQVEGGFFLPGDVLRAAAGPDGRFRLRDLPPGTHRASVSARGHTQKSIEFQTREGAETDLGDISLESGSVIRGQLRDAKGSPVVGGRVQAMSVDGRSGVVADVTDSKGAFLLAGLGEGRYRLWAMVGGAHRGSREVDTGGEPIEWALESTGAVAGEVVDGSGQPVDSFHVAARLVGEGPAGWLSPSSTGSGAFRIEDVLPGRYALKVSASDHADAVVSDVVVTAERTTEVGRIRLGPTGNVRGTVVDATGKPVPGAAVTVWSQRDFESGILSHRTPQAHTTPEGSFEVRSLNPGSIRVEAHHPHLGSGQVAGLEVDPTAGPTAVQVVLKPGGRLQGTIRRRGQGVAATVSAMSFSSLPRASARTMTDEDGSFLLENLPPGRVSIEFRPVQGADAQGLPEKQVWIREGETVVVEIELREILVSGRVTRSGAAAAGLRVAFDSEGRSTSWHLKEGQLGPQHMVSSIAPDGGYALLLTQPGPYTARVQRADGLVLHSRPVTVPDAEQHRIDLEFTSARVAGLLVDEATQQPIANGEVSAVGRDDSDERAQVRSGADGRFELLLEPATYVLQARASGYASTRSVLEVGAQGIAEQRLALPRGWSLRGRVVDARGQGVGTVQVFATPDQPQPDALAHAHTAADGSFELTGLTEARYNLFAGSDLAGFAVLTGVGPEASEPVLPLRAAGRVRVTVQDRSGAPVRGAFTVISAVDGAEVFGLSSFFSITDAAGVVELSVPLGTIELSAHTNREGSAGAATVEVRPGELAQAVISVSSEGSPR